MQLHLITSSPNWYGRHSGYYEQLARHLPNFANVEVLRPVNSKLHRLLGKAYAVTHGIPPRDQSLTFLEAKTNRLVKSKPKDVFHIANLEAHLMMFTPWRKAPKNVIGTIHMPRSCWSSKDLHLLQRCQSAILLYSQDQTFFESHIGTGRVEVVLHGVDIDFFYPSDEVSTSSNRILFCGQWLRDFAMLRKVIEIMSSSSVDLDFDLVIPNHARDNADLTYLQGFSNVAWHSGLTDEELRELYWASSTAIFPLLDAGANNALVECLACGVPIVSTDVGGVRDYGGGTIFPVVESGDAYSMADTVRHFLANPNVRAEVSKAQRDFAEDFLSWQRICNDHLRAFEKLAFS